MRRVLLAVSSVIAILGIAGCGGVGSGGMGGSSGGGGVSSDVPTLNGIAPSSAAVDTPTSTILAYGSNLENGTEIYWNGTPLGTSCVDVNLTPTSCSNAAALSATVPASDFATAGTATITLSNPASGNTSGGTSTGNSTFANGVVTKYLVDDLNPTEYAQVVEETGSSSRLPTKTNQCQARIRLNTL